jgi:GntR family transcriptional regulator, transcriptional repressor for pyruvate dehydrogenase complex
MAGWKPDPRHVLDALLITYMICYRIKLAIIFGYPMNHAVQALKRRRRPASGLVRLDRPDMVAEVLSRLSERIIAGDFSTDGMLPPEGALAQSFGVSRTVIREAMRTLRTQGLVEVSQGRAPRVKPADTRTVIASLDLMLRRGNGTLLHLVEARRPLESEIAALAAERATTEHLAGMEAAIDQLVAATSQEEQVEADVQFHRVLAESTGNTVFGLLLETLAGLLRESRRKTIAMSGVEIALAGHRAVLAAVRRNDPIAARAEMLDHLRLDERDLRAAGQPVRNAKEGAA